MKKKKQNKKIPKSIILKLQCQLILGLLDLLPPHLGEVGRVQSESSDLAFNPYSRSFTLRKHHIIFNSFFLLSQSIGSQVDLQQLNDCFPLKSAVSSLQVISSFHCVVVMATVSLRRTGRLFPSIITSIKHQTQLNIYQ